MNILLLNYEFPPLGGGASLQTRLLAEQFSLQGHKVVIITSHYKGGNFFESYKNITIYRLPVLRKDLFKSRLIEMLLYVILSTLLSAFIIKKEKIQYQLSFFLLPTSVTAYINNILFRVPYWVSLRGGDVPSFVPNETQYYRYFYKFALKIGKKAKQLVAVSDDLAKLAKDDFPELNSKINNIDNGIEILKNIPYRTINKIKVFMFAGRLTEQKNLKNIIISLYKIKEPFVFNIYGDGPLKPELQKLIRNLCMTDRVIIYPWASNYEIEKEMRKSDYLILLSQKEGLSMTSLQAYKNGLPIIASKVCGLQNFVIDEYSGYLTDISVSDDYSDVLVKAINNKNWSQMSDNCFSLVKEKYNINDKADEYLDFFGKK